MQWQPIETAPRDGTEVLVYFAVAGTEVVHLAWYRSEAEWSSSGKLCGAWDTLEEWEGWWSYTHNSTSQEKLDGWQTPTHWAPYNSPGEAVLCKHGELLGSDGCEQCSAEAAQAQSGDWVVVPREPTEWMLQAAEDAVNAAAHCESTTDDLSAIAYKAALAAAPQPQAAEPVAVTDEMVERAFMREFLEHVLRPAQPAQDASKYQELLMAVEKKFPGESRHETALRYIKQAELQSCEPKCDAAMAKESWR